MKDLIKALQIFVKYGEHETHCEHDILLVCGSSREDVGLIDMALLEELGFSWSDEYDSWGSYKYGSC